MTEGRRQKAEVKVKREEVKKTRLRPRGYAEAGRRQRGK